MKRVGPAGHWGGVSPRRLSSGPSEDEPFSHQRAGPLMALSPGGDPYRGRGERQLEGSQVSWAPLGAQTVDNPPAMRETWVPSLGWVDPLEDGMATYSGILAWRIPWTEEPSGLQSMGSHSQT